MRTYFFGDIHGNLYALEACLKHMEMLGTDAVMCLGDLVGWLPFGDETLERMRSLGFPTVAGNHDLLVAGLFTDNPHRLDRMQATAYNAGRLSTMEGAVDYLLSLPLSLEGDSFTAVHHSPFHLPQPGTPPTIECFDYLDEAALTQCLEPWHAHPKRIIFSGHDHLPAVYELPDSARHPLRIEDVKVHRLLPAQPLTVHLDPRSRYWIKAGSVGGPYRDGIPAANPVLYDSDSQTVTLFRLSYPTEDLHRKLTTHFFSRNLLTLRRYADLIETLKDQI